jgi:hypothetical protein
VQPVLEKTCPKCSATKLLSDFVLRESGPRTGQPVAFCRTCNGEAQRVRKERDPTVYRRCEWPSKLKRLYGLTVEQYYQILADQGGACATCGAKNPGTRNYKRMGKSEYFYVDHCHTTGRVRGLLCGACNRAIGYLKDDPEVCDKVSAYLRKGDYRA